MNDAKTLRSEFISDWVHMEKHTIALTTVFQVIVIVFLMAGNCWAVASYAKKYGMACKSCHSTGAELNDLGLLFKKNGHTFGEKNVKQKEKVKQDSPSEDKSTVSESSGKSPDKPGAATSEKTADTEADDTE